MRIVREGGWQRGREEMGFLEMTIWTGIGLLLGLMGVYKRYQTRDMKPKKYDDFDECY